MDSRPEALYNLRGRASGSWLAWANDTAAHYLAIHCPPKQQLDPRFAASRHTIAPISHTRPSPRKLLLISRPTEGRRLSWPTWSSIFTERQHSLLCRSIVLTTAKGSVRLSGSMSHYGIVSFIFRSCIFHLLKIGPPFSGPPFSAHPLTSTRH